eukprot:7826573-Alexandrium_andersonii.AAC.1
MCIRDSQASLRGNLREAAAWIKAGEGTHSPTYFVVDEKVTTDTEELHSLLYRAWAPVFHLFEDGQAPTWQQFEA